MIQRRAFIFLVAATMSWLCQTMAAAVFHVKDFGALGDGINDDGAAIRRAVDAAIESGPGAKLVFGNKTYRLGPHQGGGGQIELAGVDGLTIDGNGAQLILHPSNGVFSILRSRNVVVRGFVIDFDPLPFTQGTIGSVYAEKGFFDLQLHDGYPLPPADNALKKRFGDKAWRWGSVIDPKNRHLRWGVADHYHISSVKAVAGRTYRIQVIPSHHDRLAPIRPGDRFFLPLQMTESGERAFGGNIVVRESADCLLEDITIYSARSGMNYSINRNEGRITLRNNKITFKPGSNHLCSTWKDGMHVKDNRVGPLIEGCHFEGMLDDSINISANTAMAAKIISPTTFRLIGPAFSAGDDVMVFEPQTGETTMTTVVEATTGGNVHTVTMAKAIEGVVEGRKERKDLRSTHFYNMSYVNEGFIVRNCVFKPQRRHALLVRCSKGIFENNLIDGVGGAAVWMGNEMGSFYEGPFPQNNIIRNNTIRNTQLTAIRIYTNTLGAKAKHTRSIRIENNTITVLPERSAISVHYADDVTMKKNRILNQEGREIDSRVNFTE